MAMLKWTIEIEVDEAIVRDHFHMDDADAYGMLCEYLQSSGFTTDPPFDARVLISPDDQPSTE